MDAVEDRLVRWLESVRERAGQLEPSPISDLGSLLDRLQPVFDDDAVALAQELAAGRCDLASMPIPYKYFRHWRRASSADSLDSRVAGGLFLLGNVLSQYLKATGALGVGDLAQARQLAAHVTRAALLDEWQWVVRVPVRNLGPSGGSVIGDDRYELRMLSAAEEQHENVSEPGRTTFPTWTFFYDGQAARGPLHLRTRLSYLTVRLVGPYPEEERQGSAALDEVRPSDLAQARLAAALLAFQLLAFEPESDGYVTQETDPYWLLSARRTRPASLPPSRPGFADCWVDAAAMANAQRIAAAIPDAYFMGRSGRLPVAVRRFHHAVNLGVSRAGFLEYVAALEGTLVSGNRIVEEFKQNGARVLGGQPAVPAGYETELRDLYRLRSRLSHGGAEATDEVLSNAVRRIRHLGARILCAQLGVDRTACSGRDDGPGAAPFRLTGRAGARRRSQPRRRGSGR